MTIFSANQLKFDKDYLNELTIDPNSGVFKQQCKYHVALHPAQFNDYGDSLKDELGKKIGRFDESFQGIMLGYENIKLQSQLGVIGSDNCHVHLDIGALFYVFRPQIGMVLKGTVTRTTKDHVGCLVYNTFNISLPKPAEEEDGTWLGDNAAVNSEVSFRITFVNLNARLPHIRGDLLSIENQGDISGVSLIKSGKKSKKTKFVDEEEVGEILKKPHKNKRKKSLSVMEDSTELEINGEKEKLRKNKRKKSLSTSIIDESVLYKDEGAVENEEILPSKPKKHKKNKFKDYSSETEVATPKAKSEKKKRKKSMSFSIGDHDLHTELIIKDEINNEEEVSLIPTKYKNSNETKTKKNKKKKDKHREKDDLDISLESLDIKSLFTENMDFDKTPTQMMTDSPDKKRKRRKSQLISQDEDIYLDSVKLEPDSDLEKIIGKKEKKSKS